MILIMIKYNFNCGAIAIFHSLPAHQNCDYYKHMNNHTKIIQIKFMYHVYKKTIQKYSKVIVFFSDQKVTLHIFPDLFRHSGHAINEVELQVSCRSIKKEIAREKVQFSCSGVNDKKKAYVRDCHFSAEDSWRIWCIIRVYKKFAENNIKS